MKSFAIAVVSIFLSLNGNAFDDLKGHWVYKSDECKSGVKPNDRWAGLAYKNINLFVFDEKFSSTAVFQTLDFSATCAGSVDGTYSQEGNKVIQVIKVINQGNLENCGIQIQSPVDTPTTWTFEIGGNTLRQNKSVGGANVCGKEGDLIEVYQRALQ